MNKRVHSILVLSIILIFCTASNSQAENIVHAPIIDAQQLSNRVNPTITIDNDTTIPFVTEHNITKFSISGTVVFQFNFSENVNVSAYFYRKYYDPNLMDNFSGNQVNVTIVTTEYFYGPHILDLNFTDIAGNNNFTTYNFWIDNPETPDTIVTHNLYEYLQVSGVVKFVMSIDTFATNVIFGIRSVIRMNSPWTYFNHTMIFNKTHSNVNINFNTSEFDDGGYQLRFDIYNYDKYLTQRFTDVIINNTIIEISTSASITPSLQSTNSDSSFIFPFIFIVIPILKSRRST